MVTRVSPPLYFGATRTPQVSMPDTTGWTYTPQGTGSTRTIMTSDPPYPGASYVRLTSPSAGNYQICLFDPNTRLTGDVGFWVRYPNFPTLTSNILILLATDVGGANNWFQSFTCGLGGNAVYLDGAGTSWRFITIPLDNFTGTTGTPVRTDPIRLVRFQHNIVGGDTNTTLDVGPIYLNLRQRAKVIFSFDDNNDTDYTKAYPYLASKGLVGTCYVNPETVGTSLHTTLAQLREMRDAGWTIGGQTLNQLLGNQAAQTADLRAVANYGITNAFPHMTRHYAYGGGFCDPNTLPAMRSVGYVTSCITESRVSNPCGLGNDLLCYPRRFIQASTGAADNVAAVQTSVQQAISNGATLEIGTHRLDEPATGIHYDESDWKLIVDYCDAYRKQGALDIVSTHAWYESMLHGRIAA